MPRLNQSKEITAKRSIKDSVFTTLFSDTKYLLQLYQCLHPEDEFITENQLKTVTIKNILTNQMYNDLGFMVEDRLIILIEAQSTWSPNIVIRSFLYLAHTYQKYFDELPINNLYSSTPVKLPIPELYVIYLGKQKNHPHSLSLTKDFWSGERQALDVELKVIYGGTQKDIIHQYIFFSQIIDEQIQKERKLHGGTGRTKEAVEKTIQICIEKNILKDFLLEHKLEVIDMLVDLFDEEKIKEKEKLETEFKAWLEGCKEFNASYEAVVQKAIKRFNFTPEYAQKVVKDYWE